MKEYWKMLKRGLAMALAVVMLLTSSNLGVVLRAAATGTDEPVPGTVSVNLGKLMVEYYDELTDAEKVIIGSGQLVGDKPFQYVVPTDGGALIKIEKADELDEPVEDEVKGKITATTYTDAYGNEWYPVSYTVLVNEQPVDGYVDLPMDNGVAYHTYGGNAYGIQVTYYMDAVLSDYDQKGVLAVGELLARDIEKLAGLKSDIIPPKPEGWEGMTQQEKEENFTEDELAEFAKHDELKKFVKEAAASITGGGELTLDPAMVLMLLTMKLPDSEGMPVSKFFGENLTIMGLLGKLYDSVRYPMEEGKYIELPEELKLDKDDLYVLDNDGNGWFAKLGFDQGKTLNEAWGRLQAQAIGEDATGLLLKNFLNNHGSESYLEWLVNDAVYAELKAALVGDKKNGNYYDFLEIVGSDGLQHVSDQMYELLTDLDTVEEAAWKMISETAAKYGLTVTNEGELNALLADGFDSLLKSYAASEGINDQLADLNDQVKEYSEYGVKTFKKNVIESKQDLVDFIAYLESTKGTLTAAVDTVYSNWDNALRAAGYTGEEIRTVAQAEAAIKKMQDNAKAEQDKIDAAKKVVADLLKEYPAAPAVNKVEDIADAITYLYGLQTSDELNAANKALNDAKAAAKGLAESYGLKNVVINSSADIDAIVAANGPLDKQVEDALAAYNSRLDEVNTLLGTALADLPESVTLPPEYETIDDAEEFEEFCDWMETELAKAKNDFKATLDDINTAVNEANNKLPSGFDKCLVSVSEEDGAENLKTKIQTIRNWMNDLVATANTMKQDALDDANATLTSYDELADYVEKNGEIKTVADIDKLIAYVDEEFAKLNNDIYTKINGHEKMTDARVVYGYTGNDVKSVQDVKNIIEYMNASEDGALAYVYQTVNDKLPAGISINSYEDIDTARATLDTAYALGKVNENQYNAGVNGLESARTAIESIGDIVDYLQQVVSELEKLENTKSNIKDTLADARADFVKAESDFATMEDMVEEYGDLLNQAEAELPEAKTFITDAEGLIKDGTLADQEAKLYELMIKYGTLKNDLANKKAAMNAEKAKIVAAEEALEDARKELGDDVKELVAGLEAQRSAWAAAEQKKAEYEEIAKAMTDNMSKLNLAAEIAGYQDDIDKYLEELPAQLEEAEKAWATLETIPEYLKTLDSTRKELEDVQGMLDIMITMLELFCEAMEPAALACAAKNAWNAKNKLIGYDEAVDYAALTEAATGLEKNSIKPVDRIEKYASTKLIANMSMYDVTFAVKGWIMDDNGVKKELDPYTEKVTLEAGATAAQIKAAADALNLEEKALAFWGLTEEKDNIQFEGTNFTESLPESLDKDMTLVYRDVFPKIRVVTFGAGFENGYDGLEETYSHGSVVTLPEHENTTKEWVYTVTINGVTTSPYQGETIKITGDVTISRTAGDKSATEKVVNIVIATTDLDEVTQKIIQSGAVKLNKEIRIRKPTNSWLLKVTEGNKVTITARPYNSGDYGTWYPVSATMGGVDAGMVYDGDNGVIVTEEAFETIVVNYELQLTAEAMGIDLDQYINAPYDLASDYRMHKGALDDLVAAVTIDTNGDGVAAPLEALSMLDRDTELTDGIRLSDAFSLMQGGQTEILKNAITGTLKVEPEVADQMLVALQAMDNDEILPVNRQTTPLYFTLDNYNKQGMAHYYAENDEGERNSVTYIRQIEKLNEVMKLLPDIDMSSLGGAGRAFEALTSALKNAEKNLKDYPVSDLIDGTSDALSNLVDYLGEYAQNEPYAVPTNLTWSVPLTAKGDGVEQHRVTVNVQGFGTKISDDFNVKPGQEVDFTAEANAIFEGMVADSVRKYYAPAYESIEQIDDIVNHVYTYNRQTYNVDVPGFGTVTLDYTKREITLVRHATPGFAWVYDVVGDPVEKRNSDSEDQKYILSLEQLDALIAGAEITRTEVNVGEADLVATIEGMGGVLYKDADGKYCVVVGIDMNNTESLMNFVLGLYLNSNVKLGGEVLVSNGQFHLQTLVDALLNSGIGTNMLNANIAADGTVKNTLVLPEGLTAVGNKALSGNHLTLIETDLTLKDLEAMPLYLTLTGNASSVKGIVSKLGNITVAGQTFTLDAVLSDGAAKASVEIPDTFYAGYVAALSMVGEVDIRDVNAVNAQVAVGYFVSMIQELMNTSGVTVNSFGNTIGKDLSSYEEIYNIAKGLMNKVEYSEDGNSVLLNMENVAINAIIDKAFASIELPEQFKEMPLGDLIYEYDPAIGLDVKAGLEVKNFGKTYLALAVDHDAAGLMNKIKVYTTNDLKNNTLTVNGTAVILLSNVENLVVNANVLDLNGMDVVNLTGNGSVIVTDSDYIAAEPARVSGTVSKIGTILGGKFDTNVSAYLDGGYTQGSNGVVYNKLFKTESDGANVVVTLNATPTEIAALASKQGLIDIAAEIAASLVVNHYNMASLYVDGLKIYDIQVNDLVGLALGTDRLNKAIDTVLGCVSASDLAELVNKLVADLTDFAAIENALNNGTEIVTYETSTAAWALTPVYQSDDDTVTLNIGAGELKTGSLSIKVEGSHASELAGLAGALADTTKVDVTVSMDDIVRNGRVFQVTGAFDGYVEINFAHDPYYAIMMAVILADNADADLKADLVDAIEAYFTSNEYSMEALEEIFNGLSVKDICSSLEKHGRGDLFADIVNSLDLSAEVKETINENIDYSEKKFDLVIDMIAFALRQLSERDLGESITGSSKTLGGILKQDENGKNYYGAARNGSASGNRFNVRGYSLGYDLTVENIELRVYLFGEHECVFDQKIVAPEYLMSEATHEEAAKYYYSCICGKSSKGITNEWFYYGEPLPTIEIDADQIKIGGNLYGVKYDEGNGYLILDTIADGMTLADILAALHQGAEVENDSDDAAAYVKEKSNVVGKDDLVGTGSTITLQAKNGDGVTAEVTVTIIVLGDTNCDGVLNSGDAVLMHNYVLHREAAELTQVQKLAGNANGMASEQFSRDGIDSGDAVVVMNKWLNRYVPGKLGTYDSPLEN